MQHRRVWVKKSPQFLGVNYINYTTTAKRRTAKQYAYSHVDVITWKHFPHYLNFVERPPECPPYRVSIAELLWFLCCKSLQAVKQTVALQVIWDAVIHWGRVTHIWVDNITSIGSDNGLSPGRRQAIIWTNAGILLIGPLETNFSEISVEILTFSFKKMRLKCRLWNDGHFVLAFC